MPTASSSSRRRFFDQARSFVLAHPLVFCLGALLIGLEFLYIFYGSAGHMFVQWPIYQAYYDMLAEGFREGHLYIKYTPHPALLAAKDPWSMQNVRYWLPDGTFYDSKYYIYWGPLPALVQAAIKSILGVDRFIGDQYITFAASSLLTISSCVLVYQMAQRLFAGVPKWLVVLAVLAVGCVNPIPHLISTGGVYQGAICGGQAFLICGLCFALSAVGRAQEQKRLWPQLLGASLSWGLSLCCRFSQAPAVGLLMLGTVSAIIWCGRSPAPASDTKASSSSEPMRPWSQIIKDATFHSLLLGLPVLAFVSVLLVYNKLRFNEYFEFGTTWMTTSLKFHWSARYLPANIYAYLLQDFKFDGQFPYLHQMTHFGKNGIPSWIEFPEGLLMDEPHVGIFRAVPISWLSLVAFALVLKRNWLSVACPKDGQRRLYIVYFLSFLIVATVSAVPALGVFITTMRYMADFTHGFVLLGVFGGLSLYTGLSGQLRGRAQTVGRIAVAGTLCALCSTTIAFGLAFGFQGYNNHFARFNPNFYNPLVEQLSVTPSSPASP